MVVAPQKGQVTAILGRGGAAASSRTRCPRLGESVFDLLTHRRILFVIVVKDRVRLAHKRHAAGGRRLNA